MGRSPSKFSAGQRGVAIFDAGVNPGICFIRSLGRAGVLLNVYSHERRPAGRYSRYVDHVRPAPNPAATDEFCDWLTARIASGEIGLVAPTSDYVAFAIVEAHERLGIDAPGHPTGDAFRDCVFKDRFAARMSEAGFPTAPSETPTTMEAALASAERLGYPVVLKPRTHVGIGPERGVVVHSREALAIEFRSMGHGRDQTSASRHEPDLRYPLIQRYFPRDDVDVVSVAGCLGVGGEVLALDHSRKLRSWPPGLGTGTIFESLGEQPFTRHAIDAVRSVLGVGMFELEVLVHHRSGDAWPIDLNPRAWGQIQLAVAHGHDVPRCWYELVTGVTLLRAAVPERLPAHWQAGLLYYVGATVGMVAGPGRRAFVRELVRSMSHPRVGPALDWRDPLPAVVLSLSWLRHPRGLVRNFIQ